MGIHWSSPNSRHKTLSKFVKRSGWINTAIKLNAHITQVEADLDSTNGGDSQFFNVDLTDDKNAHVVIKCKNIFYDHDVYLLLRNRETGSIDRTFGCCEKTITQVATEINSNPTNNDENAFVVVCINSVNQSFTYVKVINEHVFLVYGNEITNATSIGSVHTNIPVLLKKDKNKNGVDILLCNKSDPEWIKGKSVYIQKLKPNHNE